MLLLGKEGLTRYLNERLDLRGTLASKINVTPKCVYFPIQKLHSILAVANLLAHNNISQICYCGQISLQSAAVNCSFSDTFVGDGTHCTIGANSVHLLIGFVSFVIKACLAFVQPPPITAFVFS